MRSIIDRAAMLAGLDASGVKWEVDEAEHVDPAQTIELELDGTLYEFKRVADAAEGELHQVLFGVPVVQGADGRVWVASRILRFKDGSRS
jgi:hypothetical protein